MQKDKKKYAIVIFCIRIMKKILHFLMRNCAFIDILYVQKSAEKWTITLNKSEKNHLVVFYIRADIHIDNFRSS